MPSLLCLLFYDAFSDHAFLFLCVSMHLEAELSTQEERRAHETEKCRRQQRSSRACWQLTRACWQLTATFLTPASRLPPRSSLVYFRAALNVFKSRAHLWNSTGSVGVDPTTALLPSPALPEISARPSDTLKQTCLHHKKHQHNASPWI